MTLHKFLNILAFCVLMGNEKVLTKSPDYILEKFNRYIGNAKEQDEFMWGLDDHNRKIMDKYFVKWQVQLRGYGTKEKKG